MLNLKRKLFTIQGWDEKGNLYGHYELNHAKDAYIFYQTFPKAQILDRYNRKILNK